MTIEVGVSVFYYVYTLIAIWVLANETQVRVSAVSTSKKELEETYQSLKSNFKNVYIRETGVTDNEKIESQLRKAGKQLVFTLTFAGVLYALIGIFFVKRMAMASVIKYVYIVLGLVFILDGILSYLYTIRVINNSLEYRNPSLGDKIFDINAIVFYFLTVLLLIVN